MTSAGPSCTSATSPGSRTREDERRLQLEDAMKDRKMLERLKARKDKAYQYTLNKEEQKLLDEAAVNRAAMAEGRARP